MSTAPITRSKQIILNSKEDILISSLLKFYSNPVYLKIFKTIVIDGALISLRLLDFFSTTYSKDNLTWIQNLDIHKDYKQYLKGYTKKLFDPFCRKERIVIFCSDESQNIFDVVDHVKKTNDGYHYSQSQIIDLNYEKIIDKSKKNTRGIVTTVGQLNFFKWCFERMILKFIYEHYDDIETQMNQKNKIKKPKNVFIEKTNMNFTLTF